MKKPKNTTDENN